MNKKERDKQFTSDEINKTGTVFVLGNIPQEQVEKRTTEIATDIHNKVNSIVQQFPQNIRSYMAMDIIIQELTSKIAKLELLVEQLNNKIYLQDNEIPKRY